MMEKNCEHCQKPHTVLFNGWVPKKNRYMRCCTHCARKLGIKGV